MKLVLSATILGLVLAGSALADGKAVYDAHCKNCHGADGAGNPAIAKMLKVTLKPLSSKDVQSKSDADLKKDIATGTGKMKPVKLSDADATAVVGYLRTLK
jgi:mono/diheme cytochrome c family protein